MMRTLIVTAVEAEAAAVRAASPDLEVYPVGVGIAAAAAGTATLLARGTYDRVISAGIAGAFAGRAAIGDVVIGTRAVSPELGAHSPDGFLPIETLGFGTSWFDADPLGVAGLSGEILCVQSVTGTAVGAEELAARYPEAVAEAMEGFGVATAAHLAGVRFGELRTISNLIGPRDKSAWRFGIALAALTTACKELL
ncbi:futalosine hydrolase [Longispora sp. K20-0274]